MEMLFLAPLVLGLAGLAMHWSHRRGLAILHRWAKTHDYELIHAHRCWWWHGPFWWRSGEGNVVFRVTVRRRGELRRGHVRCGGLFLGILTSEATVEWENRKRP